MFNLLNVELGKKVVLTIRKLSIPEIPTQTAP